MINSRSNWKHYSLRKAVLPGSFWIKSTTKNTARKCQKEKYMKDQIAVFLEITRYSGEYQVTYRSQWWIWISNRVKNCESLWISSFLESIAEGDSWAKVISENRYGEYTTVNSYVYQVDYPSYGSDGEYDIRPPRFVRIGMEIEREKLSCSCVMIRFNPADIEAFSNVRITADGSC